MKSFKPPIWLAPDGDPLSCMEKVKVLNENLLEIRDLAQEALEDAVLIGGDEAQFRLVLDEIIKSISNPYTGKNKKSK